MILEIKEHEILSSEELGKLTDSESVSKFLHDAYSGWCKRKDKSLTNLQYLGVDGNFKAGYQIGASWIKPPIGDDEGLAIQVLPKSLDKEAKPTDYIQMFATALDVDSLDEAEYFSDYYHIDFESPEINVVAEANLITPLLLLHYLSVLTQLTKKGLRKGYIQREENLQSKVRGRIQFSQNLRKNVLNKREDRVYCKFQEYTVDTPENRFLKKALMCAASQLKDIPSLQGKIAEDVFLRIGTLETIFAAVSDDVSTSRTMKVSSSKLFSHYAETIKIAEMILRFFDYDMDHVGENCHSVRPFCIDMSRLYEMYVFHILNEAYPGKIKFQVKGRHGTRVDYIKVGEKERIVLDAKYKPRYAEGNRGIVDDVREISGYSRDKNILTKLGWEASASQGKYLPDCVIIYPVPQVEDADEQTVTVSSEKECKTWKDVTDYNRPLIDFCDPIDAFHGFYKIAIPLPTKKQNQ